MKHPVLILHRNSPELTRKSVQSALNQDVRTDVIVIDNSEKGDMRWMESERVQVWEQNPRVGVSRGWNIGLSAIFSDERCNHALVVNNDTILPRWYYSQLLSYSMPFITGVSVDSMEAIKEQHFGSQLSKHPDFSAFLVSRLAWTVIGKFNEDMELYASDNDYHVRGFRKNIQMVQADVPFYHERSSTIHKATESDRTEIQKRADKDRDVFKSIYGCLPWEEAYERLFDETAVKLRDILEEILNDDEIPSATKKRAKEVIEKL